MVPAATIPKLSEIETTSQASTSSMAFQDDDEHTPSVSGISETNNSNSATEGGDDWEVVPPEVTFDTDVVVVGDSDKDVDIDIDEKDHASKEKYMKHCQSTPDLRTFSFVGKEEVDESIVEDSFSVISRADCSSSAVVVDMPRISFRDAILRKSNAAAATSGVSQSPMTAGSASSSLPTSPAPRTSRKIRPQFVVTPTRIRRNSKSMGDLQSAVRRAVNISDHIEENDVFGESDAELFYAQKSAGLSNRRNGRKMRPDESKRLQITMVKKTLQKQRQGLR